MSDEFPRIAEGTSRQSDARIGTISVNGKLVGYSTAAEIMARDRAEELHQAEVATAAFWRDRFTYHRPNQNQVERYGAIRAAAASFADLILTSVPNSPERTRALETLQVAVMLANAAIACNELPDEPERV